MGLERSGELLILLFPSRVLLSRRFGELCRPFNLESSVSELFRGHLLSRVGEYLNLVALLDPTILFLVGDCDGLSLKLGLDSLS